MNAERLMELYDRVSEAPDAILKLRKFILDLAVRGKLVEHDPSGESAQALFHEIVSAHRRSEKSKKTRPELKNLDGPFELPASWIWVGATFPASSISDQGKKVKTQDVLESGVYPVVDQGKVLVRGYCDDPDKVIRVEGPIIVFGDHTRETKLIDFDFVVGADGVKLLQPVGVDPHYYYLALTWLPLEARGYGRHFKLLRESKIPLPPLAEQHRIVAKVDELMALCDSLEAEREKREATRDRFTTSSLSRLNAPDVDEEQFKAHAGFAINVLPEVTTRPDQIKVLRQTILDLAMRGKLVEQDPNDEPASDLLEKIAVRISDLVSKGELKKPQAVSPLPPSMFSLGLPPGWALARFGSIASIETNLVDPRAYKHLPHIAPDNIESWTGRLLPYTSVGDSGVFSGKHLFKPGVLLYSKIRPNLAKVTKVDFGGLCSADMYPILPFISRDFLLIFMITRVFVDQAVTEENRVAMPKINQAALANIVVSVPPLAEQQRIVANVNELLAQCRALEQKLTFGRATMANLLEALLRRALEPLVSEAA